ncbi:MAG: hypothetical protein AB1792_04825 [Candidatus Zixiibacteriota bacterium]
MRLLHLIFRHTELKLIALVLAGLLWLHVATNQIYDVNLDYSLHYLDLPSSLLLAAPPPVRAVVHVRGTGKALLRLMWQDRRWPIDLSYASAGTVTVRLDPELAPRYGLAGLAVTELVGPAELGLSVDSIGHRTVPIRSALEVHAAPGFVAMGPVILAPDSVRLSGPRGELTAIEQIRTRSVALVDVRDSQRATVALVPPPGYNVTMDRQETEFLQRIEPYVTRKLESLSVRIVGLRDMTAQSDPDHVAVELGGPQSAMAQVTNDSVWVNLIISRNDTTGTRLPVTVRVHPPLVVVAVHPDTVTLLRQ